MKRSRNTIVIIAALSILLNYGCKKGGSSNDNTKQGGEEPKKETPTTPFKTLNYLYSIMGSKVVAGMHNREPNSTPARWTNQIFATTGKYPALWSGDFLFQSENVNNRQIMINEAEAQYKKGALVNIMWHACNPANTRPCEWDNGKGVQSKLTDQQWTELITDGTSLNASWKAMMDEVCLYLQQLKDKNVEVMWRPLHEMNQGVFWWGGRPGANGTRKLWQITHDYMTKTKGLTNLIWVWDIQDFSTLSTDAVNYNPGTDYWDIAALDVYDGGYTQAKYQVMVNAAAGKPIAIGECEKLPTSEELIYQPKWVFFMGWSELVYAKTTDAQIQSVYNASNIITLDKKSSW